MFVRLRCIARIVRPAVLHSKTTVVVQVEMDPEKETSSAVRVSKFDDVDSTLLATMVIVPVPVCMK